MEIAGPLARKHRKRATSKLTLRVLIEPYRVRKPRRKPFEMGLELTGALAGWEGNDLDSIRLDESGALLDAIIRCGAFTC
jgi:hypothetical protein